jgi:PTS system mannose-specific IIB component
LAISFIRVDDRVIHGQVVIRWLSEYPADGVIAVDDVAANNPIISKTLKAAVPGQLRAFVLTVKRAAERWKDIVNSPKQYFLIAKSPVTLVRLYQAGADFIAQQDQADVGPMSARTGARKVGPNANITEEEKKAFEFLVNHGMTVYFQLVPDSKKTTWEEAKLEFSRNK